MGKKLANFFDIQCVGKFSFYKKHSAAPLRATFGAGRDAAARRHEHTIVEFCCSDKQVAGPGVCSPSALTHRRVPGTRPALGQDGAT